MTVCWHMLKVLYSYGVSLAMWDHTVLPATRHKWTHPALTPARQAGTRFTDPGGIEGWVVLGERLHTEMVYRPTHPSTNPTMHGRESNSQPVDHKSDALSNHYTTNPPITCAQQGRWNLVIELQAITGIDNVCFPSSLHYNDASYQGHIVTLAIVARATVTRVPYFERQRTHWRLAEI